MEERVLSEQEPVLTVITATHNLVRAGRSDKMKRCVRSIVALPIPHEHLIIDGASDDGTVGLLNELAAEHGTIRVVSEPDRGVYEAFNKGVRAARGEWVYFIGSDDFVFDGEAMAEALAAARRANVDFVISPVRNANGSCYFASFRDFGNILIIKSYGHQGVIMRRQTIERLGFFDESYRIAADFELCLRAHLANIPHLTVWKRYAEFAVEGGLSSVDATEYDERVRVSASVLKLSQDETNFLYARELLPWRIIFKLLSHRNGVIRYGAFYAFLRRVAFGLGLLRADREKTRL